MTEEAARRPARRLTLPAVLPRVWAVLLVLLLLGPALGRGYVLSYDMVFVPHLDLRPQFWGLGTAVPRAVPSDAIVAILDEIVPGMVLQKLVLVGVLLGAAEGALRLVGPSTAARMTAISVAVWNPLTVERLWLGHWTVLVGYAVVPWLAVAGRRIRTTGRWGPGVGLVALGSLSASAGLVSGLVLVVTGWRRHGGWRSNLGLLAVAVAANLPWAVTGLLHADAASASVRTDLFGLHREGSVPAPLAVLTLGGVWNSEVVPDSRSGLLGWAALIAFGALVALGGRGWWRRVGREESSRWLVLAGVGYAVALLTWLVPGAIDGLATRIPGAGVVRDGTRTLALCMPLWVSVVAQGANVLARSVAGAVPKAAAVVACCLLPVALLPDAAWGIAGRLRPASFPDAWASARQLVTPDHGDVLVLPFSSYRAPPWNGGTTVLDPLGRYLRPGFLVNDELRVSGRVVPAEDPRVRDVRRALRLPDPDDRAAALAGLGVGWVAVERDARPHQQPSVTGTVVVDAPALLVVRLPDPVDETDTSPGAVAAVAGAWVGFVAVPLLGVAIGLAAGRRRGRSSMRSARSPRL